MDSLDQMIEILIIARDCEKALNTLKMLQENGQWDKENRKRYPIKDPDLWYSYIKENIDKCIELIEKKGKKND